MNGMMVNLMMANQSFYIQDYSYNEIRNDMLKALGTSDEMTPENQGTTTETSTNY